MSYTAFEVSQVILRGKDGNADLTITGAEAGPVYAAFQASVDSKGLFTLANGNVIKFECYCAAEPTIANEVVTPVCVPVPCDTDA